MRVIVVHVPKSRQLHVCTSQLHMLWIFLRDPGHRCLALHNRGFHSALKT
jgi:hypothetical protein